MTGIPGFQAEASLARPSGGYGATAGFRAPGGAGLSMRVSPMALAPGLGLGRDLFEIRCCIGRRCVFRHQQPGEDCVCFTNPRFGPFIACSPRVFTTG
jgi:hypothetical protein